MSANISMGDDGKMTVGNDHSMGDLVFAPQQGTIKF